MNKFLQKLAKIILGLSMAAGVGVAVGSNVKEASSVHAAADTYVTMGSGSGSNNVNTWYIDSNKVTVTQNKGSGSSNPNASYVSGTNTRFYVGNVMAFVAATGYKVAGVKFTNSTNSSYYGGTYHANTSWTSSTSNITADDTTNLTLTNCASTTSGSTSTIESKSASGVDAIYIGTTKQSRPSKIEVKYTSSTTSYTTTVNVTGGALSVNNTSTSFTSALTYGYVYLTPDDDHVIPDNPASSFSVTNATLSSAYDNQDGDVALYLTSVSGNITVSGAFDEKQGTYYSVSYTGSNGSLSNTSDVAEGDSLDTYLQPAAHYHLPTSITLTMGGVAQTAGTDYDYDNVTGEIQILEVTGNIVISTSCVEDAKYTVTYVKGDHGTGDDFVVSNQYAGSYTLATFATAGFSADSGYAFKKWSVGGVEYAEGESITISGATTVTAVYQEVTTYTIVTDASTLTDGTTFVLVGYISSTYYVSNGLNSGHVLLTSKTSATTISNGFESGSTLVSTEAQVLTLEGSAGEFKIKYGDSYLKFTGSSNGNDSFDTEANASTFSASMSGSYILFTCTSSTGSGRVWRLNTGSKDMRNYATSSGVGDVYMFANVPAVADPCSVSYTGSHGNLSSTADVEKGDPLNVTLIPDTHYHLPGSLTITMGGDTLVESTDYTYDSSTGEISIAEVTGDVVISTNCIEDTKVTVTYTAGTNGSGSFSDTNIYVGTYNLLAFDLLTGVSANSGYQFKDYTVGGQTKSPGDPITIDSATSVTVNFDEESAETTVETLISTYASLHSWVNETQYSTIDMDSNISVEATGGDNTGKYFSSGEQWRIYQNESPSVEFTAASGYAITSITITYVSHNTGVLLDESSNQISSGTAVTVSNASSYTFGVGNTGSATNGQVRITDIEVVYVLTAATTYTITYYANNGSATGSMSPTTGPAPKVASCDFSVSGYTFERWNTQNDGEGTDYAVGTTVSQDVTLYAIWQEVIEPIEGNVVMEGVTSTSSVTVNTHPAIKCGAGSTAGVMTLTLTKANITKIKVYIAGWGTDTGRTINVSISSGTISESSITINGDSAFTGSSTSFTLADGEETDYKFEFTIANAPADTVITLTAANASKNRFIVWGATDLFAETFASEFMTNLTCNAAGTSAPTFVTGYSWSYFESLYDGLDAEEQGRLHDASANEGGTQIEQAMARYDYIEGKYNPTNSQSSPWKNFIGRTVTPRSGVNFALLTFLNGKNANTVAIIVIISMVSVTAIGGYFFLRRRKENI